MFKYVFVIATFISYISATDYISDCGSKLATVSKVIIENCADDADVCILKRNSNATFQIDFTSNAAVNSLNTIVHGVIMDLPVPFPIPQPDACKENNLTCPLKEKTNYNYKVVFPILKSYPKVAVGIKWELQNENKEDVICVYINARLQ